MVSRVGRLRGAAVARTALGLSGGVTDPALLQGLVMATKAIPADAAQMAEDARCYRHLSSTRPTSRRPAMTTIEIMTATHDRRRCSDQGSTEFDAGPNRRKPNPDQRNDRDKNQLGPKGLTGSSGCGCRNAHCVRRFSSNQRRDALA